MVVAVVVESVVTVVVVVADGFLPGVFFDLTAVLVGAVLIRDTFLQGVCPHAGVSWGAFLAEIFVNLTGFWAVVAFLAGVFVNLTGFLAGVTFLAGALWL